MGIPPWVMELPVVLGLPGRGAETLLKITLSE